MEEKAEVRRAGQGGWDRMGGRFLGWIVLAARVERPAVFVLTDAIIVSRCKPPSLRKGKVRGMKDFREMRGWKSCRLSVVGCR